MHLLPSLFQSLDHFSHHHFPFLHALADMAPTVDISLGQRLHGLTEIIQGIPQGISAFFQGDRLGPLWSGFVHRLNDLWAGIRTLLHSVFFQGDRLGHLWSGLAHRLNDLWAGLGHRWSGFVHRLDDLWAVSRTYLNHLGKSIESLTGTIAGFVASAELWQVGLYWLLLVVMLAGVVGSFVPALPGITLVLLAILIWGIAVGFTGMVLSLVVAIVAFFLCLAIDNLAGLLSAQKVGASRWGQIGAIIGMILGFFGLLPALPVGGPLLGIIFGTVLGAFVGEFLHRHDLTLGARIKQSAKVGIAIVVGNLVGNLLQGVVALITLIVFVLNTWGMVYG